MLRFLFNNNALSQGLQRLHKVRGEAQQLRRPGTNPIQKLILLPIEVGCQERQEGRREYHWYVKSMIAKFTGFPVGISMYLLHCGDG